MKKIVASILMLFSVNVLAQETIKIYSPYSPAHSGTPAMLRIVDEANARQNSFRFVLEFKPGGNQVIAVKSMESEPQTSLSIIAPAYVENVATGKIDSSNHISVHSLGDACWMVAINKELKDEVVVGGVGIGNAAHLTSLALAEKFKFNVRYVVFRSNNDALVNMAGDNGVNFVIDRFEAVDGMMKMNSKIKPFAASCPIRLPQAPKIKTLKEMGIKSPYIFNIAIASKEMPEEKRKNISNILNQATQAIGEEQIYNLSAMKPPMFRKVSDQQFFDESVALVRELQLKYKDKISEQK